MAYSSSYQFGGFHITPWVRRLLIANAVVSLCAWLIPGLQTSLGFVPSRAFQQPWSFVTYMFVHGDFWHLFFNMLGLFFFGPPVEERLGSREFIKYYTICGLIGGAVLAFIFAPNGMLIGASGAVYAVMLAFAYFWPDMPIYIWGIFPVKAKWLVIAFAAASVLFMVTPTGGNVAHWAHFGGFAVGFIYLKFGASLGGPMEKLQRFTSSRRRKLKVIPGQAQSLKREEPPRRRRAEEEVLDEVDKVLDKISTHGMASLTAEERKLLDEVSKRYRQN
ncbi:MAG TPA: rhomboid family intramembrane serine protease [Longimicrobiales bacterium]